MTQGACAHINVNTFVKHAKRLACYTCEGENVPEPFAARGRTGTSFPALPQMDQADLK
jgi:hypothetical protein